MISNAEKGKRVIVGGFSAHLHNLPLSVLDHHPVIGVNQWPECFKCDYYLAIDTRRALAAYPAIQQLACPKFFKETDSYDCFHGLDGVYLFNQAMRKDGTQYVPTHWHCRLRYVSSSAIAAISLAIILGASECVLYGVDFTQDARYDGRGGGSWVKHIDGINALLDEFGQHIKIWKTNPASQLKVPMWPELDDWRNAA